MSTPQASGAGRQRGEKRRAAGRGVNAPRSRNVPECRSTRLSLEGAAPLAWEAPCVPSSCSRCSRPRRSPPPRSPPSPPERSGARTSPPAIGSTRWCSSMRAGSSPSTPPASPGSGTSRTGSRSASPRRGPGWPSDREASPSRPSVLRGASWPRRSPRPRTAVSWASRASRSGCATRPGGGPRRTRRSRAWTAPPPWRAPWTARRRSGPRPRGTWSSSRSTAGR